MDPLKLSYEARVHASQNKRLPVQIVLHALYYDQLKLRSGVEGAEDDVDRHHSPAAAARNQLQTDVSLVRENEALRAELTKMKLFVNDIQRGSTVGISAAAATAIVPHAAAASSSYRRWSRWTGDRCRLG